MTIDWDRLPYAQRQRYIALSRILRIPIEGVPAWEDDAPRRYAASDGWDDLKEASVPPEDTTGRQAVSRCTYYGLSIADVRAARDRDLLLLYGMGPTLLAYLRNLLAAPVVRMAPAPPLPCWVAEE